MVIIPKALNMEKFLLNARTISKEVVLHKSIIFINIIQKNKHLEVFIR